MSGRWTCRQHGDACESYVKSEIGFSNPHSFNARHVTPSDVRFLPVDEQVFVEKCLKWVEER